MKNMLRKDFFMEIKKSWGRFVSIFFIVALGVAFYSGIRSSEPSMRISGDAYFDKEHLMDIKVIGTMGLTKEDVRAIEETEGIELAEGGYSKDVLCSAGDTQKVVHIMSAQSHFNDVQVSEGRMPQKAGECLMDEDFARAEGYRPGDTIRVSSGDEEDLSDSLTADEFKIVGLGNSPLYISFGRGSSTIGNGEVSAFLVVDDASFCMDLYTEIYVRAEGGEKEIAFTEGYDDRSEAAVQALEKIEDERCRIRKEEILSEAESELKDAEDTVAEEEKTLEDARKQLDTSKRTASEELKASRQKLEDAQEQLDASRQQIEEGKQALAEGEEELRRQSQVLADGEKQYEDALVQVEKNAETLAKQEQEYLIQYEKNMPLIQAGKEEIAGKKEEIRKAREEILAGKEAILQILEPMRQLSDTLADLRAQIEGLDQEIESGQAEYDRIENLPAEERTEEEQQFLDGWKEERSALEAESDALAQELQRLLDGLAAQGFATEEAFQEAKSALEEQLSQLDAQEQELQKGEQELLEKEQMLLDRERQLTVAGEAIKQGNIQIEKAQKELEEKGRELASAREQIREAQELLSSKKSQAESGEAALLSGEKELREGWSEYEKGAAEAARKIADGEAKITDGERQLEEAKQDIADARAEIEKIENPVWYIQDRSGALAEYDGYGENADRMRAIGQVFPAIFFLVAALISLTAMTRMVEEQRIQIGTLKALGYRKISIAWKYIAYALSATLGGSILGVLFGEKVFPWIIIYAYKIMYQHIPDIVVPYHLSYALQATLIAVICTLAATAASCYKELAAVPAQLMRPPAPKQGQRILLERVKIVWGHLNFTWKSSIRNLVRYKKRFFMTLFGIGGCMSLMVVGFGLKDSIFEIPELQYENIQHYDAAVYFDADLDAAEKENIRDEVDGQPAVQDSMQVRMQNLDVSAGDRDLQVYLTVPEDTDKVEAFVSFRSRTGTETYSLRDDQVILTEKAAKDLEVEAGDRIVLEDDGRGEREVTVGAVCENYMGHYLYMAPELYEETFKAPAKYNGVLFQMKEGEEDQTETVGSRILNNEDVLNISYTTSIEDQLDDMLRSLNLVIVVLIISAGMLAFVVLYNLNTINITERKRELATIKVLGFYDMEVASYVYRENILLTIIGALAGMGIGRILLQFVIVTVEVDEVMFGRVIHAPSYLYSFLFTLGFSLFVNWVMYFKLKNIDMVESLKSVE